MRVFNIFLFSVFILYKIIFIYLIDIFKVAIFKYQSLWYFLKLYVYLIKFATKYNHDSCFIKIQTKWGVSRFKNISIH